MICSKEYNSPSVVTKIVVYSKTNILTPILLKNLERDGHFVVILITNEVSRTYFGLLCYTHLC